MGASAAQKPAGASAESQTAVAPSDAAGTRDGGAYANLDASAGKGAGAEPDGRLREWAPCVPEVIAARDARLRAAEDAASRVDTSLALRLSWLPDARYRAVLAEAERMRREETGRR
jgi:hypothetical protein